MVCKSRRYFYSVDEFTFSALTDEELEFFESCLAKIENTLKGCPSELAELNGKERGDMV